MTANRLRFVPFLLICLYCGVPLLSAQEAKSTEPPGDEPEAMPAHLKAFQELMDGVTLRGQFTTLGEKVAAKEEESYEIVSAEKMIEEDLWMITAKIQYGGKAEMLVPVPVEVKFAGEDTPVITMTNFMIPLMGTFSARVVLYNGKYAGTWSAKTGRGAKAAEVGGHMFGVLEPTEAAKDAE